jgi:hypothetical protein
MPVCIYCSAEKAQTEFNREHVVHAAFGGFEGALTLVAPYDPSVCSDCNTAFSSTIDLAVTRDSMEAMLRLDSGLKAPSEVADLFRKSVRFQLPADNEFRFGPLHVMLVPTPDGSDVSVAPVSQVRFQRKDGGFKSLTEQELLASDPRLDPEIDAEGKKDLFWPGFDEGAQARLISLLNSYGIPFKPGGSFHPPADQEADFEAHVRGDRLIARAIAKIALNYLAKVSGKYDQSFVLHMDFDPIRLFVRYGDGFASSFVRVVEMPAELTGLGKTGRLDRHVLRLNWKEGPDESVLCFVRLFGVLAYVVRLAHDTTLPWRPIQQSHEYDLRSRRVKQIGGD